MVVGGGVCGGCMDVEWRWMMVTAQRWDGKWNGEDGG